ncbi:MAG: hypothetical protein ACXV3T_08870 [Halobacteriota archaeon]
MVREEAAVELGDLAQPTSEKVTESVEETANGPGAAPTTRREG